MNLKLNPVQLIFQTFLFIVFVSNCIAIYASIKYEVIGEGFHRTLKYHINTGSFRNKSCHLAVYLNLPAQVYVNSDEIAELRRSHKTIACVEGELDVELFAEKAKTQQLSICSRLSGETKTTLSVPVHQRYQFPSKTGKPVNITIPRPNLLIGCRDKLKDHRISKIKLCRPCIEYSKKWRDLFYEWENAKEFIWQVPVGNTSYILQVTCITLFVTVVGAIFILWSLWKTYKEEKNSKMKDS